ncbi:MAG TPA: signal peptidase II [Miltoncostaeaceae bacterium]|jgi:signal peptidase II|nr:signal peptidase II [Miltoncostaeaceae bacterium]
MSEGTRVSAEQVRVAAERRERREARTRGIRLVVVALAVLVADQALKEAVRSGMARGESRELLPFLELTRVTNEGIAFGLFPGRQAVIAGLTLVALCLIAVALAGLVRRNMTAAVGAGLLVGGSMGNLLDRVLHGGVTDYIDFRFWPAFNLADVGITVGAAMVVMGLLRTDDDDARDG